jgi:hypothetical protein
MASFDSTLARSKQSSSSFPRSACRVLEAEQDLVLAVKNGDLTAVLKAKKTALLDSLKELSSYTEKHATRDDLASDTTVILLISTTRIM